MLKKRKGLLNYLVSSLALMLFSSHLFASSLTLTLNESLLSQEELQKIKSKLIIPTLKRLPPIIKKRLNWNIQIEFKMMPNFSEEDQIHWSDCSSEYVGLNKLSYLNTKFTTRKTKQIILHPLFKKYLTDSVPIIKTCRHNNIKKLAIGELVHHLVRIFDLYKPLPKAQEKELFLDCGLQNTKSQDTPYECNYYNKTHRYSVHPKYLNLIGANDPYYFSNYGFKLTETEEFYNSEKDQWKDRDFTNYGYDLRELKSPHFSFAVNAEYYIMNNNFGCVVDNGRLNKSLLRKPAKAIYFYKLFNKYRKLPTCISKFPFNLHLPPNEKQTKQCQKQGIPLDKCKPTKWINALNVSEIHFAVTDPFEEELASRWGHASLIFVMCKPNDKQKNNCLKNLNDHLVVEYHSQTQNLESDSTLKYIYNGIIAEKFVTQLYNRPLAERVLYYISDHQRRVNGHKLKLTTLQRIEMVALAFERHTLYRGRWNHLKNNCTTNIISMIKAVVNPPKIDNDNFISPIYSWNSTLVEPLQAQRYLLKNGYTESQNHFDYTSFYENSDFKIETYYPLLKSKESHKTR